MLKFFAILALLYFFLRSVGHVVRLVFGRGNPTRMHNPYTNQQRRRTDGGLHVDSIPNQQKKKTDFKGGDYVDYEEVDK